MRALVLIGLGWLATAAVAAAGLPKVAVMVDRGYFEVATPGSNGFDQTFYPSGQGAAQWSERQLVRDLGAVGNRTLADIEAAQRAEAQAQCAALSSLRVEANGATLPVWQWLCPAPAPAPTALQWVKPVIADGRAYLAQAQFQGPAPAGRVPAIAQAGWERAVEFIARFNACARLTDPGCVPVDALTGKYGEAALSAGEQAGTARIAARGLAMHYQDQLAWHATDYVQARKLFTPGRRSGGYLSVPGDGRSGRTYFVAVKRDRIDQVLQVDTGADGEVSTTAALAELPAEVLPRWHARQTALASKDLKLCSPSPNTLVLPVEDGDGWWVYVMSASTRPDEVFLGGHNRLRLDGRGDTVLSIEYSARGCLALDAASVRALKQGEGAFLSHLVSPLPWETDVMQSLTFAIPFTRVTESGVWRIEGDRLHKWALEAAAP